MKRFLLILFVPFILACEEQNPGEYHIAYNVLVDEETENYDIMIMGLDGADKQALAPAPGVEWTYVAKDHVLYFISDRGATHREYYLYTLDLRSGVINKASEQRLADSWQSVNEEGDIVVKLHDSYSQFHVLNKEGSIVNTIETGLPYASDPNFAPDGKTIVFRGGQAASKVSGNFNEALYTINLDGSGLQSLTKYPLTDTTASWYDYKAGPPKWHPTDDFISFQSYQNGKYSLYGVSPDGEKQWKLTENAENEGWHSWSSDGKWLAIELFNAEQTQFHIGLLNWESKKTTILTDSSYKYQQAPVFVLK